MVARLVINLGVRRATTSRRDALCFRRPTFSTGRHPTSWQRNKDSSQRQPQQRYCSTRPSLIIRAVAAAQAVKRDQSVFHDTCDVRTHHDARVAPGDRLPIAVMVRDRTRRHAGVAPPRLDGEHTAGARRPERFRRGRSSYGIAPRPEVRPNTQLRRDVLPGTMTEHRVRESFRMIQMRDTPYHLCESVAEQFQVQSATAVRRLAVEIDACVTDM